MISLCEHTIYVCTVINLCFHITYVYTVAIRINDVTTADGRVKLLSFILNKLVVLLRYAQCAVCLIVHS
jgi:hypothetical protein